MKHLRICEKRKTEGKSASEIVWRVRGQPQVTMASHHKNKSIPGFHNVDTDPTKVDHAIRQGIIISRDRRLARLQPETSQTL